MAVLSREEMIERLSERFGDDNSDEVLSILEDVSDTFNAFNATEDWETKYKENDAAWRKKYRDRFETGVQNPNNETETEVKTFEDLFK